MLPLHHVIASGIVSIFIWTCFKSLGCAAISFAAGVLIDADHVIDYFVGHGFSLKFPDIYKACATRKIEKLYLLFHSYELIALLWIFIYIFSLSIYWKALAIGLTQHMIFDQVTNPIKTFGYFLTYRMIRRFSGKDILR